MFPRGLQVPKTSFVYPGDRELEIDGTRVLPREAYLRRLHRGEILG